MAATLAYCFLLGLLHGIVPDEHTWPITFSYAIGSGAGGRGMRAGIYFGWGFTAQRMLLSELSYFALAPFLRTAAVSSAVYWIVGVVMSLAGWFLLRRRRYAHPHLFGRHHDAPGNMGDNSNRIETARDSDHGDANDDAMPVRWALMHGFIAGFGFGGFGLFVNAVAAPSMPGAWLGFLPGFLFGAGTMVTLAAISMAFANGLKLMSGLDEDDVRRFGANVGATTLFGGGFVFMAGGLAIAAGLNRYLPIDIGYIVIAVMIFAVAIPAFVRAWRALPTAAREPQVEYSRRSAP